MNCQQCGRTIGEVSAFCPACGAPVTRATATTEPTPQAAKVMPGRGFHRASGLPYATWWQRLAAMLIDTGVALGVGIVFVIVFAIVASSTGSLEGAGEALEGTGELSTVATVTIVVLVLAFVVGIIVYEIVITASRFQGTVGKIAMGLAVVGRDGDRLTGARSTGRWAAKLLYSTPYVGSLVYIASAVTIGASEDKQAIHDMIATTYVVRRPRTSGAAAVPPVMQPPAPTTRTDVRSPLS